MEMRLVVWVKKAGRVKKVMVTVKRRRCEVVVLVRMRVSAGGSEVKDCGVLRNGP